MILKSFFLGLSLILATPLFANPGSRSNSNRMLLIQNFIDGMPFESIAGDDILSACNPNWEEFSESGDDFSISVECQILGDMYRNKKITIRGNFNNSYLNISNIQFNDIPL